jgi:hypothetical protein
METKAFHSAGLAGGAVAVGAESVVADMDGSSGKAMAKRGLSAATNAHGKAVGLG